jgi:hypothetical protein
MKLARSAARRLRIRSINMPLIEGGAAQSREIVSQLSQNYRLKSSSFSVLR